ncbi:MAG: C_GCAxxG_C_C family protein [Actinobacteria bacterium]|nr:C_GCAxxG_C_C family protein [Actinomycetota bacterium]
MAERTSVRAACLLEGGGASQGSTCGVVSGGCMAITLAHLADMISGEAGKGEALYERLREYTDWFESEFGSTICRERCGAELSEVSGLIDYLITGKVITRCIDHIGKAVSRLPSFINRPLQGDGEVTEIDRRLAASGGYCAAEVLRGIREDSGYGSLFLEQLSVALDGGIGLSGGLCGALAGAILPISLVWGIDPRKEGLAGTIAASIRGQSNLYFDRQVPELWGLASLLMREFKERYASLECRDIVGRSFRSGSELAEHMSASSTCAEIKAWCRERSSELIAANTVFAGQ